MRYLSRVASSLADKLGYMVLPKWRLDDYPLERHLRRLFQVLRIDTVLDVGANAGQYGKFLRHRVGFGGHIHSFEPLEGPAEALRANAKGDGRWHVHQCALGMADGTLTINVTNRDTFSSFLRPSVQPGSRFAASSTVTRTEAVPVRSLDSLWNGLGRNPTTCYLKVDTQGYDLRVLGGGLGLLQHLPALQFEWAIQPIYEGTASYLDALKQLNDWGFTLSGLFPVSMHDNMAAIEFDCVMVSNRPTPS